MNLTPTRIRYLCTVEYLSEHLDRPVTVREIASRLDREQQSAHWMIRRLEDLGLLYRHPVQVHYSHGNHTIPGYRLSHTAAAALDSKGNF